MTDRGREGHGWGGLILWPCRRCVRQHQREMCEANHACTRVNVNVTREGGRGIVVSSSVMFVFAQSLHGVLLALQLQPSATSGSARHNVHKTGLRRI